MLSKSKTQTASMCNVSTINAVLSCMNNFMWRYLLDLLLPPLLMLMSIANVKRQQSLVPGPGGVLFSSARRLDLLVKVSFGNTRV